MLPLKDDEAGQQPLEQLDRYTEVDTHHRIELGCGGVGQRFQMGDARIVDQDVDDEIVR